MSQIFNGKKKISTVSVATFKGFTVECTIYDEWIPIMDEFLKCGMKSSLKVVKKTGVSTKNIISLENEITSSIGKGSFLEIRGVIKKTLSNEHVWLEETINERVFSFEAPNCGHLKVRQFQLLRTTQIITKKDRVFRKPLIKEYNLQEYSNKFYDNSTQEQYDDSCDCDKPPFKQKDGYLLGKIDNLIFDIPYKYTKKGIEVNIGKEKKYFKEWDLSGEIILADISNLSDINQFLLGSMNDEIEIIITKKKKLKMYYYIPTSKIGTLSVINEINMKIFNIFFELKFLSVFKSKKKKKIHINKKNVDE